MREYVEIFGETNDEFEKISEKDICIGDVVFLKMKDGDIIRTSKVTEVIGNEIHTQNSVYKRA